MRLFTILCAYPFALISIHAPLTGCDDIPILRAISASVFQSTHPLRDATFVSITFYLSLLNFNPRTPYGMRHLVLQLLSLVSFISIHAPLTGCDFLVTVISYKPCQFQSTHPLRDATTCSESIIRLFCYFNPRTPYGMRQFNPYAV